VNYAPKIQVFTSNIPLREAYIYKEDQPFLINCYRKRITNPQEYSTIDRRFDYIIEHRKIRDDLEKLCRNECTCCKIVRIFHKGSREKFNNLEFDIEFNNRVTEEKAKSIIKGKDGRIFQKKKLKNFYWRPKIEYDKSKFITTNYDNIDNKKTDIIVFPDIIEKLNLPSDDDEIIIIHEEKSESLNKQELEEYQDLQIESSSNQKLEEY
jgi:hypothetical protein